MCEMRTQSCQDPIFTPVFLGGRSMRVFSLSRIAMLITTQRRNDMPEHAIRTRTKTMQDSKLVDGPTLLEQLFDKQSRPSLRWLRAQQKNRSIPFVRVGRLVFFD